MNFTNKNIKFLTKTFRKIHILENGYSNGSLAFGNEKLGSNVYLIKRKPKGFQLIYRPIINNKKLDEIDEIVEKGLSIKQKGKQTIFFDRISIFHRNHSIKKGFPLNVKYKGRIRSFSCRNFFNCDNSYYRLILPLPNKCTYPHY